ncbi:MAG TPA: ATP-binding cassette domain-containing protein, partial [Bacillota bacterium]|nr:ATP-binding cassette domain-containing protein [Bacillota bacterium]
MPVIDVRGLNKSFGSTPILSGVCCAVHEYDKIGLVGRNGTGKTTLIRILAGLEDYDSGTISMPSGTKLSYLSQNPDIDATRSLMEYALEAFADLDAVEEQMREVERSMAELPPDSTELKEAIRKYDRLMGHMSAREGYDREYRTKAALFGLGFAEDDLDRRLGTFSGGQVMRASLARLLLSEPDLMLLDEPTNHLDLSSMEWLESYLKSYKGSMVLVSHDRYFLEAVIDHVWELEELGLTAYEGSYEDFLAQKEFNLQNRLDQYERQQEYMEKLADYIRRYKAGNRT